MRSCESFRKEQWDKLGGVQARQQGCRAPLGHSWIPESGPQAEPDPPGPLLPAGVQRRRPPPSSPSPCHPVGKNSRAQALGTVMGATCWPDVPGRARQECGALGSPARPRPLRAGPAPARTSTGTGEASVHCSLLSWVSHSRVQGLGWPEPDSPPGPAIIPPGSSFSTSASVRGGRSRIPGSFASSEPSWERASGEDQLPAPSQPGIRTPPTSSNWRFFLSLSSSSQMSVSFLLRIREQEEGVGRAGLDPRPSSPTSSPLTPAALSSAPGPSLKTPPRPVASLYHLCHFCCPWDFAGPAKREWESLEGLESD